MELKDTVNLMNSQDYNERFRAEYYQLKIRYEKLRKMIAKYKAGILDFEPICKIEVLEDQLYYMNNYLETLEIRAEIEKINLEE